ncbi:hypothetical protein PsorP6_014675 [Peronosclerospora sorghi]|uniref:Uncharacterized protein n=1 Tax=Peronosclerospora sorghi TaxID=230839 RepID=A0ACC0VRY6_9STRA|nr:hypothetical protein PsorP6_014675 [Peronosclerospora sorghi]
MVSAGDEFQRFDRDMLSPGTSMFDFWKLHHKSFPTLALVSAYLSCICTHSMACERTFLVMGWISARRSLMTLENLTSSVKLYSHFKSSHKLKLNWGKCEVRAEDIEAYLDLELGGEGVDVSTEYLALEESLQKEDTASTSAGQVATPLEVILEEFKNRFSSNFKEFIDQDCVAAATTKMVGHKCFRPIYFQIIMSFYFEH